MLGTVLMKSVKQPSNPFHYSQNNTEKRKDGLSMLDKLDKEN
jgi:hypothetical protein